MGAALSRRWWVAPVLVLLIGAVGTGALVAFTASQRGASDRARLDRTALEARSAIADRVDTAIERLFGVRSFMMVHRPASREDFHRYVRSVEPRQRTPDASTLSFDRAVPAAGIAAYEAKVRGDRSIDPDLYARFTVRPAEAPDPRYVIETVEPLAGNETALGFDVGSDPARRAAIEAARDSGEAVATPPLQLVQQNQQGRGVLVFLGVYDRDSLPVTGPARRRSFVGVVAAVFRAEQILASTLRTHEDLIIDVYDVGPASGEGRVMPGPRDLLFSTGPEPRALGDARGPSRALDLSIADRRWRIIATPSDAFRTGIERFAPLGAAGVGGLVTLLFAGWVTAAARSRQMAQSLALRMTSDIRDRERELEASNRRLGEAVERLEVANVELADASERLVEADRARTAFLGTVSHELRTPLTAIIGFSDLLKTAPAIATDATLTDYLARISRNSSDLAGLIDELLDYTRVQRNSLTVQIEQVDLSDLVRDVVAGLETVLATHAVQTSMDGPVPVRVDPRAATRVLSNLLTNAAKFSPTGSAIRVEVHPGGTVSVSDRGPGVSADDRERIFEPFYRGRFAEAGPPGTGVGLTVVRALMTAMGGSVEVDEASGGGARFIARFTPAR